MAPVRAGTKLRRAGESDVHHPLSEKLLDALDARPPRDAWKVIALTEAEISTTKGSIPDWGIGGLGSIDGPSCVVSLYLLRKHSKTREALARRLADLAVHELGHTPGP